MIYQEYLAFIKMKIGFGILLLQEAFLYQYLMTKKEYKHYQYI